MKNEILLGYEQKTGEEIYIKPSHMIVTGITQLSGKTTTLEALIKRSELKAIAFKTKIGETGFSEGFITRPFFQEKSDWQYVESLLEATMKERLRFERSWIIKASKGTQNLNEVYENCKKLQQGTRESSLQYGVYTNLIAYLELILPQLKKVEFSKELILRNGVNIMDLERLSDEVQSLVIRSVLEYVLRNEKEVVVIIPEAWKFLPQARGNPVKQIAESFIRQGATNHNYLWIDSQDMAGVDKTVLKQVANWVLGLQTERNEVQHTLDQIPLASSLKPKTEEIMTLRIGHFIVCNPDFTKKVYVLPSWLDVEMAKEIAIGTLPVEAVIGKKKMKLTDVTKFDEVALSALREELRKMGTLNSKLERENSILKSRIDDLKIKALKPKADKNIVRKYNWLLKTIKKIGEQEEITIQEPVEEPIEETAEPAIQQPQFPPSQTSIVEPNKNLILAKLGKAPRAIYQVLIQNPNGLTKAQISLMTGYSITSSSFSKAISKLRTMQLIRQEGDVYRVV